MKASELIKQLEELIKINGDLPILVGDTIGLGYEEAAFVEIEKSRVENIKQGILIK